MRILNALCALTFLHFGSLGATAVPPAVPAKSPLSLNLRNLPTPLFNNSDLTAPRTGTSFPIPGTGLTLNLLNFRQPYRLPPVDTNLCITNALIEMFLLLYNHNRDYILPVGYHVSYGSVKFAIIDKGAIVESYLMLSDAVLVLKGLALIENGIGYEARAVEVLDDRRGILCLAVLVR